MKVGSLVKYVKPEYYIDMITPQYEEIYTVREICMCQSAQRPIPHMGIKLEEITNNTAPNGYEMAYVADHFVEVQPPMDDMLKELLSYTPELTQNA